MTINELRIVIRNALFEAGLDADMRNMAGTFSGGMSSASSSNGGSGAPPGLGDEEDDQDREEDKHPEQFNQPTVRSKNRHPDEF